MPRSGPAPMPGESSAESPGRVRRGRGSSRSRVARCRARRFPSFWGAVRIRALAPTMRRTSLRSIWLPRAWAAAPQASRVLCVGAPASASASVPSERCTLAPRGGPCARATIGLRSSSVRRGLRPAPGRSPRPSIPSVLKRTRRSRTVWGWHPNSCAIAVVWSPSPLRTIIRARWIQSPGACRLWASRRIWRSSTLS